MSEEEKKVKHDYNYNYIKRNTAALWANTFLKELVKVEVFQKVPRLKNEDVLEAYKNSKKRYPFPFPFLFPFSFPYAFLTLL